MHEPDAPEPVDQPPEAAAPEDTVLDGFEADLDDVASALDSLDADDLDAAEALVIGLGDGDEASGRSADT